MHRLQLLLGKINLRQKLGIVAVVIDNLLEDSAGVTILLLGHICSSDINQRVDSLIALGVLLLHFLKDLHRLIIVLLIKELLSRRVEIVGINFSKVTQKRLGGTSAALP